MEIIFTQEGETLERELGPLSTVLIFDHKEIGEAQAVVDLVLEMLDDDSPLRADLISILKQQGVIDPESIN